jgi:hypothetical protein
MDKFNAENWSKEKDIENIVIAQQKKQIKSLLNKQEKQRTTNYMISQTIKENIGTFKKPRTKPVKGKTTKQEAWLCLSDWQIGKETKTYNSKIAEKRIKKMTAEVKAIMKKEKPAALHIILQGDMVEGEAIFPGQQFEIDSDLWQQALKTTPMLIAHVITELADVVPKVCVAAVHGNHGRSGTKGSAHSRRTNWDLVAYETAKHLCDKEGYVDVVWDISTEWFVMQKVAGHGIMCVHGDQIGGGSPIPLAGIFKKAQGWQMNIPDWKYLSLGHFHTHASGVLNNDLYFFLSGSPESDNEFAAECLAQGGAAMQRLCFFTKKHGLVREELLWME